MAATNEPIQPASSPVSNHNPRDYESKREIAQRLGVSIRTIDNLMKRGLPHVKLTRKLTRFPRAAVDEWMNDRCIRRG